MTTTTTTEVRAVVDAVREECKAKGNNVSLRYFRRVKEAGKPHHAKAGNLNNAILNEGTSGQFLLIFDCDMVAEPAFLDALLPHFYTRVSYFCFANLLPLSSSRFVVCVRKLGSG